MTCRHCKEFVTQDKQFGYCLKYKVQALMNENCEIIKKLKETNKEEED